MPSPVAFVLFRTMSGIADPLSLLLVSFQAVIPAFGWIVVGMVVRRLVPSSLMLFKRGERFVFYLGMPTVLCLSASRLDFSGLEASSLLIAGTLAFTLVVVASYLYSIWRGFTIGHCGVVSQSAYRGNLAIIGLALCGSAFGQEGLVLAAMPIAIWTLSFNIIAVILLSHTHGGKSSPRAVLGGLLRNPLILGIVAGAILSVSKIPVADPIYRAGDVFTLAVIPFALFCMGGSISLRSAKDSYEELVTATVWRLLVAPIVVVLLCVGFGVRGTELGVAFLLLGGPAAVACHVMVAAMGGNQRLAANIVMVTTLLAPFSLSVGLFGLNYFSLL